MDQGARPNFGLARLLLQWTRRAKETRMTFRGWMLVAGLFGMATAGVGWEDAAGCIYCDACPMDCPEASAGCQ